MLNAMPLEPLSGNLRVSEPIVIGRGYHGMVDLDPTSMIVTKRFLAPDATRAADQAQREFEHLQRFSAVLEQHPFLHCPEPLSVEPQQSTVEMTYCPGSPLDQLLAASTRSMMIHLDHIAEQIAIAVECYTGEFNEPYYDLTTHNMLYEISTRTLSLIDFASPRKFRDVDPNQALLEISLGTFIRSTTYLTVGPTTWTNHDYWKCQKRLSVAVLSRLSVNHDLRPSLMRHVSTHVYNPANKWRRPLRTLWDLTVGKVLFNRRRDEIIAESASGFQRDG